MSDVRLISPRQAEAGSVRQLHVEDRQVPALPLRARASASATVCAHDDLEPLLSSRSVSVRPSDSSSSTSSTRGIIALPAARARPRARARAASGRTNRSTPCIRVTSWRHTNSPMPDPAVSAGARERLTERVERVRRHAAAVVGERQTHERRPVLSGSMSTVDAARAAVHDGVLQQVAHDGVEAPRIHDDVASPLTSTVELGPVLGQPRDRARRRRSVPTAAGHPAARRTASSRAESEAAPCRGAAGRAARAPARVGPVFTQALGLQLHARERRLQVVRERQEERLERLRAAGARAESPRRSRRRRRASRTMNATPSQTNIRCRRSGSEYRPSDEPPRRERHGDAQPADGHDVRRAGCSRGRRSSRPPDARAASTSASAAARASGRRAPATGSRPRTATAADRRRVERGVKERRVPRRHDRPESIGPPDRVLGPCGDESRRSTRGARRRGSTSASGEARAPSRRDERLGPAARAPSSRRDRAIARAWRGPRACRRDSRSVCRPDRRGRPARPDPSDRRGRRTRATGKPPPMTLP